MIRAARRGQHVVRLKGGDPFVFGRGGEEALALGAAGVPFEVIPGVSAAIAAAGLAGIPVTHRGIASAFAVVSGHAAAAYQPVIDSIEPGPMTLVFLMAVSTQRAIAAALLTRGWPGATPAAIALGASRADEETWTGTLAGLANGEGPPLENSPGTLIIGDVVRLRSLIADGGVGVTTASDAIGPAFAPKAESSRGEASRMSTRRK
jgi:uroporphyrin-III C-methyltransferase/precorrin-2 dehydrogenase/sirohydrochlorin ferrochelatase